MSRLWIPPVALKLADAVQTEVGLQNGFTETNPLYLAAWQYNPVIAHLIFYALALTCFAPIIIGLTRTRRHIRGFFIACYIIMVGFMVYVVTSNHRILMGWT